MNITLLSLAFASLGCPEVWASDWELVPVPNLGADEARPTEATWYRCMLRIPTAWTESESLLVLGAEPGCGEVYFNGVPLSERDAEIENAAKSYALPTIVLRPDQPNLIAVRCELGVFGASGVAPRLIQGEQEIALDGMWQALTSPDTSSARWPIEGGAEEARLLELERENPRLPGRSGAVARGMGWRVRLELGEPLSGDEARSALVPAPGWEPTLFAEHPGVTRPLAADLDSRGRLWVLEGGDALRVARFALPDALPSTGVRFEVDSAGARALAVRADEVWVRTPDELRAHVVTGDAGELASVGRSVLSGFGESARFTGAMVLGPDGALYGVRAGATEATVREQRFARGVWRYAPERDEFAIVSRLDRAPYGLGFDGTGQLFVGVASSGSDAPGLICLRPGYDGEYSWAGEGAPSEFRAGGLWREPGGELTWLTLGEDLRAHRLSSEPLRANFAGVLLSTEDQWFEPTALVPIPGDGWLVLDAYGAGPESRSPNGRIWQFGAPAVADRGAATIGELLELLESESTWRSALRELDRRDEAELYEPLLQRIDDASRPALALRSLWALYLSGLFTESDGLRFLALPDDALRAWSVRLLANLPELHDLTRERLARTILIDRSARVRGELARLAASGNDRWSRQVLVDLFVGSRHDGPVGRFVHSTVLELLRDGQTRAQLLEGVLAENTRAEVSAGIAIALAEGSDERDGELLRGWVRDVPTQGVEATRVTMALNEFWSATPSREVPADVAKELWRSAGALTAQGQGALMRIGLKAKMRDAQTWASRVLRSGEAYSAAPVRLAAIELFGAGLVPGSSAGVWSALQDTRHDEVRRAAFGALKQVEGENFGAEIVRRWTGLADPKATALLLARDLAGARVLTDALASGAIELPGDPVQLIDRLRELGDEQVNELIGKWEAREPIERAPTGE